MQKYINVQAFFSSVYLVDFSPSLCEVATKRFEHLGWKNVKVVCQDARTFRLEDHESKGSGSISGVSSTRSNDNSNMEDNTVEGADLITMSYSLSMMVS